MPSTLRREAAALLAEARRRAARRGPLLDRLRQDPATVMTAAGLTPDAWQKTATCSRSSRALWLCSRQSGKSTTAAALALREALVRPGALVLLLSRAGRQSAELFRKVKVLYAALGRPVPARATALELEFVNGARVVSLPGTADTVRCFSGVALLIVDEAARVPDDLYYAVRPMLAVSRGRLLCLSSAWAKQGWFYDAWEAGEGWERVKVTAPECPRISPEFLEEERQALGPRWFAMEYLCEFGDAVDAVFRSEDIERMFGNEDVKPLFGG